MFLCLKIVLKKEAQYTIVLYCCVVGHSNILCLWLLVCIFITLLSLARCKGINNFCNGYNKNVGYFLCEVKKMLME